MSCMRFEDFAVGQSFTASITITKSDFEDYTAFARTRNILHKNPKLAEKEGIKGIMLPGRSIIARAQKVR
jgi:acyl dehydratase